jgi:hypothetical protein
MWSTIDSNEELHRFANQYESPDGLLKRPVASQFAELLWAVALIKTATSTAATKQVKAIVTTFGAPYHRSLLYRKSIEGAFRDWSDLLFFADSQRKWQRRIFKVSLSLRSAGRFPTGTDDLAVEIAQGLESNVPGARWTGPLYTAPSGFVGRRPSIEASVSYGLSRFGYLAIDGKYLITSKEVLERFSV